MPASPGTSESMEPKTFFFDGVDFATNSRRLQNKEPWPSRACNSNAIATTERNTVDRNRQCKRGYRLNLTFRLPAFNRDLENEQTGEQNKTQTDAARNWTGCATDNAKIRTTASDHSQIRRNRDQQPHFLPLFCSIRIG